LAQALLQWMADARHTAGAVTHVYEDLEQPHAYCLTSEWPALEALEVHAGGREFGSLVGAIELLAVTGVLQVAETIDRPVSFRDYRRRVTSARGLPRDAGRTSRSTDD
jgi:quinol monooxygenase YgiN